MTPRIVYRVKEVFGTVQGEGSLCGTRAVFARFSGCNMWSGHESTREKGLGACRAWCDTSFATGEALLLTRLLDRVREVRDGAGLIVLTGGEPALQVDEALIRALRAEGLEVACETNGSIGNAALLAVDHLTISPKLPREGTVSTELVDLLSRTGSAARCELKVVCPGGDGSLASPEWAPDSLAAYAARLPAGWAAKYLMPRDDAAMPPHDTPTGDNAAHCVALLASLPGWRLGVQAHKAWGLP